MSWFDVGLHLFHLFLPALSVAALGAGMAKVFWRRDLAHRSWLVLASETFVAGAVVTAAGLALFGQDGRMATYLAMCLVCALTLWWLGLRGAVGESSEA